MLTLDPSRDDFTCAGMSSGPSIVWTYGSDSGAIVLTAISRSTRTDGSAFSFTVSDLVASIQRHIPEFTCTFEPDIRQKYADSWPDDIDDDVARSEWGWAPKYDLDAMVDAMLVGLRV